MRRLIAVALLALLPATTLSLPASAGGKDPRYYFAPAPLAGAGIGILALTACGYLLIARRRRRPD